MLPWTQLSKNLKQEPNGGLSALDVSKRKTALKLFANWATGTKLEYGTTNIDEALERYKQRPGVDVIGLHWARFMMERAAADSAVAPVVQPEELDQPLDASPDEDMAKSNLPPMTTAPIEDEHVEEEFDDEEPEEEEVPPSQRRKGFTSTNQPQRPIVVQVDSNGRVRATHNGPRVPKAVPRHKRASMFQTQETVRIYMRDPDSGGRVLIADYTTDEIGNLTLAQFIQEYVHPHNGYDDVPTSYEACAVDSHGREIPNQGARFTLNPLPHEAGPNDAMRTVRDAFSFVKELQTMQTPAAPKSELLSAAQQTAAKSGDMSQLMMLMMMEKMMAPKAPDVDVMKVLERLETLEGKRPPAAAAAVPLPPWAMHPPPPAMPSTSDKVLDLAIAKMAQPPPSFSEQMKDMMAFQQLMKGSSGGDEVSSLRTQLAMLQAQVSNGAAAAPRGSLEDAVGTVEKMSTVMKALGPTLNPAGGLGGIVQGILADPKVSQGLGQILGTAMAGQQGATPPAVQAQAAAAQAPVPAQPAQPPQAPQAVIDAVKAFQMAQTREVQVPRFVDVLFTMYLSKHAPYVQLIEPAMGELNLADKDVKHLALPRKLMMQLLAQAKPELMQPDFVDAVIAALAQKAGVTEMPKTLLDSAGKWTLDYRGEVLLLNTVAVPVEPVATVGPVGVPGTANFKAPPAEPLSAPRELPAAAETVPPTVARPSAVEIANVEAAKVADEMAAAKKPSALELVTRAAADVAAEEAAARPTPPSAPLEKPTTNEKPAVAVA